MVQLRCNVCGVAHHHLGSLEERVSALLSLFVIVEGSGVDVVFRISLKILQYHKDLCAHVVQEDQWYTLKAIGSAKLFEFTWKLRHFSPIRLACSS